MNHSVARGPTSSGRVLVLGAAGQVGRELVADLTRRGGPMEVVGASRSHPDPDRQFRLEEPETVERLVSAVAADHVILTAGATNVAWCEEHPSESRAMNVGGTEAATAAAHLAGASFTFISTDYVFDGTSGPYGEDGTANPINAYGAQKLEAEEAVMAVDPGNLVIRTCQVFGDDPRRTNFVVSVVDRLRRGEPVAAAGDLFGTPTYAPDLARVLVDLTLSGASGIWHVAGDSFLSRYELAKMAATAFECERAAILEVTADRMDDPVDRPRRAGLRNDRLAAAGLLLMTPLRDALAALAMKEMSR